MSHKLTVKTKVGLLWEVTINITVNSVFIIALL